MDYCDNKMKPVAIADCPFTGNRAFLPTGQIPAFWTHGMTGCLYRSASNVKAGTLTCPGWTKPVQCVVLAPQIPAPNDMCQVIPGQVGDLMGALVTCNW